MSKSYSFCPSTSANPKLFRLCGVDQHSFHLIIPVRPEATDPAVARSLSFCHQDIRLSVINVPPLRIGVTGHITG
jgi:hypothetical protein